MSTWRFILTPLTPLHIGAGEEIEAYEYVITDRLYKFNLGAFITALEPNEQEEFLRLVETSILRMRDFIRQHEDLAQQYAQFSAAVSSEAKQVYEARITKAEGDPTINPFIKSFHRPYIPGSALKGALRTALLYHAMDKDNPERNARRLEQAAFRFRRIQEDPFRAFKVGDGSALESRTHVRAVAVNTQRASQWSKDVDVLVETVPGALSDAAEVTSQHPVTFDADFYRYHERAFHLSPGAVLAACRDFYGTHLAAERETTRGLPQTAAAYDALVARAESLPDHACLVRMAWGSGRDATTVAYALRDAPSPRSRRLTADGFPLGWAELAVLDTEGQPVAVEAAMPAVGEPPERAPRDMQPRSLHELQEGMELEGTVKNTVNFGAFVDIGVGQDGLIHISKLADRFVERVEDIVRANDRVRVRVLDVDIEQGHISLQLVEVIR